MTALSLIHYTAFVIYLYLILFIIAKNPKAALNWICALLIGCFAIWSFGGTFFYGTISENRAKLWANISAFGGCSFASFYLWFSLKLTNKERLLKQGYFYLLIFSIPAFFIYLHWTNHLAHIVKEDYGWNILWPLSTWTILFYVYYLSFTFTSIYLIYRFGQCARYEYERKQAKLIVILSLITLVAGSITVILLPLLKFYSIPSMGSVTPLILITGIAYAITKYKLMIPTPAYAASDILATMSDSLILIDPDGKIIEANTATLNLLGYTREEIIGGPVEIILATKEASFLQEFGLDILLITDKFEDYHMFYRTKNGADLPVSISGSILRDQEHNLIGIVVAARDQREMLRLHENERAYIVEKARTQALEEQARELQDAYENLKTIQIQLIQTEKMAAVGQLAGGVAHELNNPLGVILGFAQSITKRIRENNQLYLPLKSIEREAVRCKKLIENLLVFSRTGKSHPEMIDINATIDETLSLIVAFAQTKQIELIKEYTPDLPRVIAHKNQLQQVIMNVCANAINTMPEDSTLTIMTKQIGPQIEINISKPGPGISQEGAPRETGEEHGLGLSLRQEIFRKHQSVIEMESVSGKDLPFRIKLPINKDMEAAQP